MLPEKLRPRWVRWLCDLQLLARLKVPRCSKPENFGEMISAQLHNFADACQNGYGQCYDLRIINKQNQLHCVLVTAKSRISPIKSVTIPTSAALVSAQVNTVLERSQSILILSKSFGPIVNSFWFMLTTSHDVSMSSWPIEFSKFMIFLPPLNRNTLQRKLTLLTQRLMGFLRKW